MPRLLRLNDFSSSRKKGQWYLISAVMVSGIFLIISTMFKGYFLVDTSEVITNEDYYFWSIQEGFNATVSDIGFSDCYELNRALDEYITLSREKMAEKGYFLYMEKTIDCGLGQADYGILFASDSMVLYRNLDPNDVIKGITIPIFDCLNPENACYLADLYDLCEGLDIVCGSGYETSCCNDYGMCC